MNFLSKLWIRTKFYTPVIVQFSCLITVTLYTITSLYSLLFLYAYVSSQYLITFFLTLFTIMTMMRIFHCIARNIWTHRNSMKTEVWSSILDNPQQAQTLLDTFELNQRIGFLTQYDRLGDTALKSAVRSNNTQAVKLILEELSSPSLKP